MKIKSSKCALFSKIKRTLKKQSAENVGLIAKETWTTEFEQKKNSILMKIIIQLILKKTYFMN